MGEEKFLSGGEPSGKLPQIHTSNPRGDVGAVIYVLLWAWSLQADCLIFSKCRKAQLHGDPRAGKHPVSHTLKHEDLGHVCKPSLVW